jgi:hypothetical protein
MIAIAAASAALASGMGIFLVRTPPPYHGWPTRRALAAALAPRHWRQALSLPGGLEYRSPMLEHTPASQARDVPAT